MKFDVYIIGGHTEETEYGTAFIKKHKLVATNITYIRLKGKLKKVLDNLAHERYNEGVTAYIAYEVYPTGAMPEQFPVYNLLTEGSVPYYNEFLEIRNRTGNFDTHRRWIKNEKI